MQTPIKNGHEIRIRRACDHIEKNLDGDLSLETLSGVAALSKYHFHRVFSAHTGMSVTRFVQLFRLRRASLRLAFQDDARVTDVAFDAGFESPEAFSRAFKRTFEQTPSQFKRSPEWGLWSSKFAFTVPQGDTPMDIKIVDFPETRIALVEHRGPHQRVYDTAQKFIAWRKETGLSPVKSSATYGIAYHDPNTTPPEDFRFDICGDVDRDVPENAYGVKAGKIPGGRCAVIRHFGSHDTIDQSAYAIYRDWLPSSGEECRDFPCFFHYLNLASEVDECDLVTDVYVPLK